jgi:hypothetical protein
VQAQHGRSGSLLADEAAHSGGFEFPSGLPVGVENVLTS